MDTAANTIAKRDVGKRDAVPLYHQIFLTLRDEILRGERREGALLPTEHELSDAFGVSRITARRALDELAESGLVERRRRVGTRVIYRASTPPLEANLEHAVESLLAFGRDTEVKVIAIGEEAADAETAMALGIVEGAKVLRGIRLRYLQDEPLGQTISDVPIEFAEGITEDALARTPMLALLRERGQRILGGRQTISALTADPQLAARLGIEPRAAVLRIERVVTGAGGVAVLRTVATYRADRYRISLDLSRGGEPEIL
jgi:GntR family transcriptional regulator